MNILKQTLKIFSSKLFINIIIVSLLVLSVVTLRDGICYHQGVLRNLSATKMFENADNFIHIQYHVGTHKTEDINPEGLSFNPVIHRVGRRDFIKNNYSQSIYFYDEALFSKSNIHILKGRMPEINPDYIEILSVKGRNKIGDIYDVNIGDYDKIKVVGLIDPDDYMIRLGQRVSSIDISYLYFDVDNKYYNTYDMIGIQDSNITLHYDRNCILEYDFEVYNNHKTEIMNELNENYQAVSLGEKYKEKQASINQNIKETILLSLIFLIPTLVLMFIFYHNLFAAKSNIIGTYYLVGYSLKEISAIFSLLSFFYIILYSLGLIIIMTLNNLWSKMLPFWLAYGFGILIIFMGLIYIVVKFKRTPIIKLIKMEGEN